MSLDGLDDLVHLIVIGADDEGGVAGLEEAAGGGQFGHGETGCGQVGGNAGAVVIIDDGEYKLHKGVLQIYVIGAVRSEGPQLP